MNATPDDSVETATAPQDFCSVVRETLSDDSVVFNVEFETPSADLIVFDCDDQVHANTLAELLRRCTNVEIVGGP